MRHRPPAPALWLRARLKRPPIGGSREGKGKRRTRGPLPCLVWPSKRGRVVCAAANAGGTSRAANSTTGTLLASCGCCSRTDRRLLLVLVVSAAYLAYPFQPLIEILRPLDRSALGSRSIGPFAKGIEQRARVLVHPPSARPICVLRVDRNGTRTGGSARVLLGSESSPKRSKSKVDRLAP